MAVKATAQETVFDLTDAYSIMLTSESYTFNGNTSGVPAGKTCSTQVVSYLGGTPMKSNISKVTCPTGISVSLKDNNTIAPTITFTTTATVKEDCEASIAITVDDVTISKKFSFAVAKTGSKGDKGDVGAAGNGIKSISYYYARSSSQTAPSESSITGTSIPILDATNKYLWQKEVITFTNNTAKTTVVLLAVYGNTGAKGDKGNDGTSVTIKSQAVTYQASSSGTVVPNGPWSQGIPAVTKGQYLWTRTVITFSNDVTSTSYSVGYMGTNGQNGSNGSNGKDGNGIKSTEVTYQIWKDGTSTPNGTWSTSVPDTTADKPYLWTRTVITYTDNSQSTSYSVGSTLKGVNVGGRNLLLKSKDYNDKNYYFGINYVHSGSQFKNCNIIKISLAWNGIKPIFTKHVTERDVVKAGDILTYSIYARTDSAERVRIILFNRRQDSNNGNTDLSNVIFELTSEWKRYSVTFTVTEGMLSKETGITYFGYETDKSTEDGKFVYFSCPKLELGNIATDWTPAPEDVDEGINNAQSSADKANSNANNAQNSANNALDAANKADAKADQAKADSAAASSAAQIAKKQADNAQAKSNEANRIANGAVATISPIAQVVIVDDKGLKILNSENNTSYAQMQSTGLFVFVNNEQRAVFGATSKVENMAIQDYLMFGSHRAETKIEDGEEGTAFFHIGDVK